MIWFVSTSISFNCRKFCLEPGCCDDLFGICEYFLSRRLRVCWLRVCWGCVECVDGDEKKKKKKVDYFPVAPPFFNGKRSQWLVFVSLSWRPRTTNNLKPNKISVVTQTRHCSVAEDKDDCGRDLADVHRASSSADQISPFVIAVGASVLDTGIEIAHNASHRSLKQQRGINPSHRSKSTSVCP